MVEEAIAVGQFVASIFTSEKQVHYIVHSREVVLKGGRDLSLDSIDMSSSVFIAGWSRRVRVGYIDHTSGLFLNASRIEIGSLDHDSLVFVGPDAKDVLIKDLSYNSKLVVPKGVKVTISSISYAEGAICEYDPEAFSEDPVRWAKRLKVVQEIVKQDQERSLINLPYVSPYVSPWNRLPEGV